MFTVFLFSGGGSCGGFFCFVGFVGFFCFLGFFCTWHFVSNLA